MQEPIQGFKFEGHYGNWKSHQGDGDGDGHATTLQHEVKLSIEQVNTT